jgi:hypothetical protein
MSVGDNRLLDDLTPDLLQTLVFGKFPQWGGQAGKLPIPFFGNSLEGLLLGEGVTRGAQLGGRP